MSVNIGRAPKGRVFYPQGDMMDFQPDYIIVGAGSAGCVLANRLSESGRFNVALIEAGGSDLRPYVHLPLGYGKLFYNPAVNWMYQTEPDAGLNGQRDYWPRGRVLGGSSSINAMVYTRGHADDYHDWGRAATGWGWDSCLAAYKKIEDTQAGGDAWRGAGGPLFVSANTQGLHPLVPKFLAACNAAGLPLNPDFNGATQEGAGIYQMTIKGARRNSSARAFLRPAKGRANLKVITHAQVTRVLIENHRAVGVSYMSGGQTHDLRCKGEVILSGGAINSPQLLQLSGIGKAADLAALGLDVVHDNPNVGAHLTDHQGLNYTFEMTVPTYNSVLRPWWGKVMVALQYLAGGRGPLAKSINHAGGFFRTRPELTRPNMQLYFQAFSTLLPKAGERPLLTPDPFHGLSIGLSNCRPSSRGHIRLGAPDPFAHPIITANVYSTQEDVTDMLAAVRFVRKIAAQEPLAQLIKAELRPGPSVQSEDDLIDDFRNRSGTVFHPSCTARMGDDPATTVLDNRLRVRGVEGLRVIDAAAFPNLIAGNTNAPSMMIGWRGADLVLADAKTR